MATVISDINIVDTEKSFAVVDVSNRNLTMMFSVKVGEIWGKWVSGTLPNCPYLIIVCILLS